MAIYKANALIVPTLPDGRLFVANFLPAGIDMIYRQGHISERLLRDMTEFMRHIRPLMSYDPARVDEPPDFETLWERRPPEVMHHLLFAPRVVGPGQYLWVMNANHISAELCDEVNTYGHKEAGGVLQLVT